LSNTEGPSNSFFGRSSGRSNTVGAYNVFAGFESGYANDTGWANAFLGYWAGRANTSGHWNAFAGTRAGYFNTTGSLNSFSDTNVGIGITAPERRLHVAETGTATIRGVAFDQYSPDAFASVFLLRKSRNATPGSHTIIQNGDALFNFTGQGSDGTKFVDVARIRMEVDGIPGTNDMPGRMTFWTTPDGAAATVERMRIDNNGNVGIGTTTPTDRLHVAGNIRATGSIYSLPAPETEIPDYVFEPDYKLMSADELQQYLQKEKHLPNIPNAAEIREKGLNLSEFQLKLLEKIEELTLYSLRQAKAIQTRENQVELLQSRLSAREAEISEINARLKALEELAGKKR
jgi:trimeric autotransporter adhesin